MWFVIFLQPGIFRDTRVFIWIIRFSNTSSDMFCIELTKDRTFNPFSDDTIAEIVFEVSIGKLSRYNSFILSKALQTQMTPLSVTFWQSLMFNALKEFIVLAIDPKWSSLRKVE